MNVVKLYWMMLLTLVFCCLLASKQGKKGSENELSSIYLEKKNFY